MSAVTQRDTIGRDQIPQAGVDADVSSVEYGFGAGVADDGSPALQAIKRWYEDGEEREIRLTLDTYGTGEEVAVVVRELNRLLQTDGVEQAMHLAESIALASGQLQAGHDHPRLFTEGPPDPFQTDAQREQAESAHSRQDSDIDLQHEAAVEEFRDHVALSNHRLLEPIDPIVNYSFDVAQADPWTLELSANKWWFDDDGQVQQEARPLDTYSLDYSEVERATERERAAMDREELEYTYRAEGLEASMRKAEAMAVANGQLDPNRVDGRLFFSGPPDRFIAQREAELASQEHPAVASDRDEWEELLDHTGGDAPEQERHYWLVQPRPVETTDGQRLGTALFVTEFPQLPLDFDEYVKEFGMDDSIYPTEARTVEMAHLASDEDARTFEAEFRSYLVPKVLEGPDLAPEVAKLEGLPGTWQELDYWGIVDFMSKRTLVREAEQWHLHNPNAEREAREQFENGYSDIDL